MVHESHGLVGVSESHRRVLDKLATVASTDAEILITGPSGVGKELYAMYVHAQSYRKEAHFVPLNCGCLSADLLENELFGHVGGAFTGAKVQHEGLVSEAEGGTLFLDEVNSLSIACQIKLLRFLQDKKYRRLGEARLRQADVRIIAASNVELWKAVEESKFREDLFFRLRVVPIEIHPLKDRPEDIGVLVVAFVQRFAARYNLPPLQFTPAAKTVLERHDWPGNVRELENCIACLTCLRLERPVEPDDLPIAHKLAASDTIEAHTNEAFQSAKSRMVDAFERKYIRNALIQVNGNISAAARTSGKDRRAMFELIRKHNIDPADFRNKKPQDQDPG
jgi:two-component system response regulator GlrR